MSHPAPIDHAGVQSEYAGEGRPAGTAVAVVDQTQRSALVARPDPLLDAVAHLRQIAELAVTLLQAGFMPKAINTEAKAVAVMLTGREMGLGPMQAIRGIHIVDGKPVVAADLQLALFKRAGGRAQFVELTKERAILALRHPNGDEHTETWTWGDAIAAQLANKDTWKKSPVAMMRSRVITAALKSIGFEATTGTYDPDEADMFAPGTSAAIAEGRDPNAGRAPTQQASARIAQAATPRSSSAQPTGDSGSSANTRPTATAASGSAGVADIIAGDDDGARSESRYTTRFPYGDKKSRALDALEDDSEGAALLFDDEELEKCGRWVAQKLGDAAKPPKNPEKMLQLGKDLDAELRRRSAAADLAAGA